MSVTVERRQVALGSANGNLWPTEFLILEATPGEVRIAHYRLRRPKLDDHLRPVDDQSWEGLVEGGYVKPSELQRSWLRQAAKAPTTISALRAVLRTERHDPDTVCAYLRATAWGAGLP